MSDPEENQKPGPNKPNVTDQEASSSVSPGLNQSRSFDPSRRIASRVSSVGSRDSINLMSQALSKAVSDHHIAGPHGALQPAISMERWSIVSTHTLVLFRHSADQEEFPVEFDMALAEIGHGCFQYMLLALCGFVYACCSLSTTTLSIVLPAAQDDFQLDSIDKGVLNTAPLWGMVAGAYIWGNFADSRGRRFVLVWSLAIDCVSSFLSSLCQVYSAFYFFRIFNGFAIIGATSIVFAYMGEFLDHTHRDTFLARLELFWTLGIIALPCIGLAILPLNLSFGKPGVFVFDSWRIFVFACGIPSLIAVIFFSRMPESPRFLLLQGKLDKAKEVLVRMFMCNTGKARNEFSVKLLHESPESNLYYFSHMKNMSCWARFKKTVAGILKQHKALFTGKSLFNIIVTCYIDFGLISVYYTMMLWVPELLNREEHYMIDHPNVTATLCETAAYKRDVEEAAKIDIATFVHTIITCMACLPTTLMLLCLIELVNKKTLLCGIMISSAVPAVCLGYVYSTFQVVTMLSLLKSLTNLAEAILFCAIVQIFPITTRGSALSLTVTTGRFGAIVGNIVFGSLIDHHCNFLFFLMGGNLVMIGLASLLLPKMRRGH